MAEAGAEIQAVLARLGRDPRWTPDRARALAELRKPAAQTEVEAAKLIVLLSSGEFVAPKRVRQESHVLKLDCASPLSEDVTTISLADRAWDLTLTHC